MIERTLHNSRNAALCTGMTAAVAACIAGAADAQTAVGWGRNNRSQITVPAGVSSVQMIECGLDHTTACVNGTTAMCWGANPWGQSTPPAGLGAIRSISGGDAHTVAVTDAGVVVCWGDNVEGQCDVPAGLGKAVAAAAGFQFSGALLADGTVRMWGMQLDGRCTPPTGLNQVIKFVSGADFSLALRSDGTVTAWGSPNGNTTSVPVGLGPVKDIAAGNLHALALQTNGVVVAWGNNTWGQSTVPAGLTATAIAAGGYHSLALRANSTVAGWGAGTTTTTSFPNFGQSAPPASLTDAIAVSAGEYHSFAISRAGGILSPTVSVVTAANGVIDVTITDANTAYWTGPNGFFSTDTDLTGLEAGTYVLTVSGAGGSASRSLAITGSADTTAPVIASYTASASAAVSSNCTVAVADFRPSVVASDDRTAAADLVITQSPAAGTLVSIGAHAVTITVADAAGNTATASATFNATGTTYTFYTDADGDTYGTTPTTTTCSAGVPAGFAAQSGDCNDANPAIRPGITEICNQLDDNCNAQVDEGLTVNAYYVDADDDGYGLMGSTPVFSCSNPAGTSPLALDCNDSNASINPDAFEVCDAGNTDENCNGVADDLDGTVVAASRSNFYRDADADGYTVNGATRFCHMPSGYEAAPEGDCNDAAATVHPNAVENCANDGTDNDCDGEAAADAEAIDSTSYYTDGDQDGFGAGTATKSCTAIAGSVTNATDCNDGALLYTDGDGDGFGAGAMAACGVATSTDCNDAAAGVFPGAAELCANDGTDNDCDGEANADAEATDSASYFVDGDQDGFGAGTATKSCTAISGSVTNGSDCNDGAILYADTDGDGFGAGAMAACGVATSTDCNNNSASVYPGAPENCANDGTDNDCDGEANSDAEATDSRAYYRDTDADGFGASTGAGILSCTPLTGRVPNNSDCNDASLLYTDGDGDGFGAGAMAACGVATNSDCNDAAATVFPGAAELCANDGTDNDCDGEANADAEATDSTSYFVDGDHDNFGAGTATKSCTAVSGSVTNSADCNDAAVMYADNDGDTYGAGAMIACGGVATSTDCNDAAAAVFPGAAELCANDGTDNDCDGEATADAEATDSTNYFVDGDHDNFGAGTATKSCTAVAGSVTNATDCNDAAATVFPGAAELCANDGVDNDCDGEATADAEATDSTSYFVDGDHDGFGAGTATKSCTAVSGSVTNSADCNDAAVMYADNDGDTYGAGAMIACGGVLTSSDCNDAAATVFPGAAELCANDGTDNDCDGEANADAEATDSTSYFVDGDQDGFGAGTATKSCTAVSGSVTNSADCNDAAVMFADNDGDTYGAGAMIACGGVATSTDCNDAAAAVFPGAAELCANDGVDNDCDGEANADAEATDSVNYFVDGDQDGFGAGTATKSCTAVAGSVTNATDCDDASATVFPGAAELCANDGVDNDCDGEATADAEATDSTNYFVDGDQDGFGAGTATKSCTAVSGSVTNSADCNDAAVMYADNDGDTYGAGAMIACGGVATSTDCNDAAAAVFPGAAELCANDGVDNDCDGEANADAEATDSVNYFVDGDQDGFGAGTATKSCTAVSGSVTNSIDCDDANKRYADADGDGFGAGAMIACGGVLTSSDCNDAAAAVFPGAAELCANDGVDNDCDGEATADAEATDSTSYFVDGDHDGFGAGTATKSCTAVSGSVTNSADCNDAAVMYADNDGDTYGAGAMIACGGVLTSSDCNDAAATVFPGAAELCANDGVDNDCDGEANADAEATDSTSYFVDGDQDGFGAGTATKSCTAVSGSVTNSADCNDASVMYADNDGDTYGAGAMIACGGVATSTDCNDAAAAVHPGAAELCANDGVDNDCDGETNADAEATDSVNYFVDGDHDNFGAGTATKSCTAVAGSVTNATDCNDASATVFPGAAELCANDGVDNDCDGEATADAEATDSVNYFVDGDQDGFGAGIATKSCTAVSGSVTNSADCNDAAVMYADNDGDTYGAGAMIACGGVATNSDCNDAAATVHPGAQEFCNSIDDDCDATVDDGIQFSDYYTDADQDGFGSAAAVAERACQPVAGKVTSNTDCNDAAAAVFPGATENCANDGVDNDCDGEANADAEATDSTNYFVDGDQDGFGAGAATKSCTAISGSVTNSIDCDDANKRYADADGDGFGAGAMIACGGVLTSSDCNDAAAAVFPGAAELCANDGTDNDCDGEANADAEATDSTSYFVDGDQDGFGAGAATKSCTAISGSVTNSIDCDDANKRYADADGDGFGAGAMIACGGVLTSSDCNDAAAAVFPGAAELCANDGTDNDCDGEANADAEATDSTSYFVDGDQDGFGAGAATKSCTAISGSVTNSIDCDDANKRYADADGDGFGAGAMIACGGVLSSTDCDDGAADVHPGAAELCANRAVDNDCDGTADSDAEATDSVAYYTDGDADGFGAGSATMSCVPVAGSATNNTDCNDTKVLYTDADADGFGAGAPAACGVVLASDCNDQLASAYPGAIEDCANDGIDNDCDGEANADAEATDSVDYFVDGDQDGFGAGTATRSCTVVTGSVTNATDCNDGLASVHPGASEQCNEIDDDCDALVDDGIEFRNYFVDADNDGFGSSLDAGTSSCTTVSGSVLNNLDCNDSNAAIKPGATETCNGIDDNCAGGADDGLTFVDYFTDSDNDGFGSGAATSSCQPIAGSATVSGDCDDSNSAIRPGATELCNGIDDNCAGGADDGLTFIDYFTDADGDTYGASGSTAQNSCAPVAGRVTNATDCDDTRAAVHPGATETCNGIDDNCAGGADDGLTFVDYFTDADGDTYGASGSTAQNSCAPVAGRVTNATDCDDTRAAVHPGATETCNGIDDNCAGGADDGLTFVDYFTDADGDTYGASGSTAQNSCAPVAGRVTNATDCDDTRAAVHPGATETCNGIDDNCAGGADDGLTFVDYFTDSDNDGFGSGAATSSCQPIAGSATVSGDCDDSNSAIRPGATELCNGIDDNCAGGADDGLTFVDYFIDADGDTYGASGSTAQNSCAPVAGRVTNATDCDDTRAAVHPGATEVCNHIDDDCDSVMDDGLAMADYYPDADADTFGSASAAAESSCSPVAGKVTNHGDCDDASASVRPGAIENCANDGIDNDCDGEAGSDAEAVDSMRLYTDADGDAFGAGSSIQSCTPVAGRVTDSTDCNDSNATIHPGAPELCDALDNNCAGDIDEGLSAQTWFRDADADGFGDPAISMYACGQPAGFVSNADDRCPADGGKQSPGVCGCGHPDADSDQDTRIDCVDIALSMIAPQEQLVAGAPYIVRVTARTISPILNVTGMQLAVRFDASRLTLADVVPVVGTDGVGGSPFSLEIGQDINNTLGTLRYALGIADGETGMAGSDIPGQPVMDYDFVDLVFTVKANADLCAQDIELVRYQAVGSWQNVFVTAATQGIAPSLASVGVADLDLTAPEFTGIPASVATAADAGTTLGAFVAAPTVTVHDNCTHGLQPVFAITYPNGSTASAWPANGMFPVGHTVLSWTATDDTGNQTSVTRTIDVANHQLLDIAIRTDSYQAQDRTISVRINAGASAQVVEVNMPRWIGATPGVGTKLGIQLPVAAGYDCISAKDTVHSLSTADMGTVVGTRYQSSYTVVQGDSNDDNRIDITDFSLFVVDRSVAGNFNREANARSNFNADNRVDNTDFGNISIHFFERGQSCSTAYDGGTPRDRVSVKELRRTGQGDLAAADLNGDGWVDRRDIQIFMQGGPAGDLREFRP